MELEVLKERLGDEIDQRADLLVEASHRIHERPELGYEEHFAHELLTGILDDEGLDPDRGAYDLPTAFAARAGTEGPTIAVCCEYDALPGIGHACGHNIIGTAGLGAGLAAAALADEVGGRVLILGTPAQEGGGGKVLMADEGAFDGVDAGVMVHPAGGDLLCMNTIAVQQLFVDYHGEAAHAAALPHAGRNALDAAVLGYNSVAALRQHIRTNERVHGIFTHAGDAPNVVPNRTSAEWYVRSGTLATLEPLKERVHACLRGGAMAAGCTMDHHWKDPAYADMIDAWPLVEAYAANAGRLGRTVHDPRAMPRVVGSTDMGNISYRVPSIHPMIKVAPANVSIHSPDFTSHAASPRGDQAVVEGAKVLAWTIADAWLRPGLLDAAKAFHTDELAKRA